MMNPENPNASGSGPAGRDQESAALVERALGGERSAFDQLIGLYQADIFRMAYFRTHSRMDSEDLTQDVFLSAYRNLSQLKDYDRFRPWLFRIAVNRIRDFHRKQRILTFFGLSEERIEAEPVDTEVHSNPGALRKVMRNEFWAHVRELSKRFSPVEREVFFLRFLDSLSLKEIAHILNKSESAVKTHLYRAIKKFKDDAAFSQFLEGGWNA
jgi:RNA polymerase sigma-70 factor, ECF subfamily